MKTMGIVLSAMLLMALVSGCGVISLSGHGGGYYGGMAHGGGH